jgi:prepilin-type N-terminal cleavage/methylation domain-containing protein
MKLNGKMQRGFTLIELLAVVAIILILMAILMPAITQLQKRAKETRAKTDVATILHAFKQYYNEYQHWPTNLVDYDRGESQENNSTGIEMQSNVVAMLAGQDVEHNNPRLTVFLHAPPESVRKDGAFRDPWGNAYKYMCDFNYDGILHIEFTSNSGQSNFTDVGVAVWSRGADKSDESGKRDDDLASWR